jgi:hypothetical protein
MERPEVQVVRIKKFNGGKGAILCNGCRVIVKQGNGITKEDWESTEPLFCVKCRYNEGRPEVGSELAVPDSRGSG